MYALYECEAIDVLIERGIVCKQQDGIVYGNDGHVILVDNRRCKYTVAEINAQIDAGNMQ